MLKIDEYDRSLMENISQDFEVILQNLNKSQINGRSHKSHWIEDIEDRIYPKRRHPKELDLIDAQMANKNKKICSGQEVSTHVLDI